MWLGVTLLLLASTVDQPKDRVQDRGRFPDDPAANSGAWTLRRSALRALPGADCDPNAVGTPCGLVDIGEIGGSRWYWYWHQDLRDDLRPSSGQLIESHAAGLEAVWGVGFHGGVRLSEARLLHHAESVLLLIPVRIPGTAALRVDFLLQWMGTHWLEVDTTSWGEAIKLPPCYGLWKGPFIDWDRLTLEMPVWIEGDGNCCPTGGILQVQFRLTNAKLDVVEWSHVHGAADGSLDDPWRRIDRAKCKAFSGEAG